MVKRCSVVSTAAASVLPLSPAALAGRDPKKILVEYSAELRLGVSYELLYGQKDERFFLKAGGDKPPFRIVMDY